MSKQDEAISNILKAVLDTANKLGREEEARLGRKLTESEARELAAMVERQFKTSLKLATW